MAEAEPNAEQSKNITAEDEAKSRKAVELDLCGWQYRKSFPEANAYMLENEIATDVSFEVEKKDGGAHGAVVPAHTYVLMSRSSVFQSMFKTHASEVESRGRKPIPVQDMDISIFREALRYIYTDKASITATNAVALMHAARRYLQQGLIEMCQKFLQDCISTDNVCEILDQCLLFGETEIKERCVYFIGSHANDVVKTGGFLTLTRNALEIVIQNDYFEMEELDVHAACMLWAKYQLSKKKSKISEKNIESEESPVEQPSEPTDLQIRECLGNVLYRIRYPILNSEAFARLIGKSSLLSHAEKASIYLYINTKDIWEDDSPKFDFEQRFLEIVVDRFSTVIVRAWNSMDYQNKHDAIQFSVDKEILLVAVGLFAGHGGVDYDVTITVQQAGVVTGKTTKKVHPAGSEQKVKIHFDEPMNLQAGVLYTIWTPAMPAACSGYVYGAYGNGGQASVKCRYVNFTFSASTVVGSPYTTVVQGQIPELYFKIVK